MDRMSPLDASFLHIEDAVSHMHIGSVGVFEGPPPPYEEFEAMVAGKLPLVPRYRQKVRFVPLQLGRPVWVDDPHFNLGYHLRHTALAVAGRRSRAAQPRRPGDVAAARPAQAAVGDVDGRGPRATATGRSSRRCTTAWSTACPAPISSPCRARLRTRAGAAARRRCGTRNPSRRRPARRDALVDLVASPYEQLRVARSATRAPRQTAATQLGELARGLRRWTGVVRPTPLSSLNGPIGPHRRWDWARTTLADVKTVRARLGGTVNDVVLTVLTRGFRDLLLSRDEDVDRSGRAHAGAGVGAHPGRAGRHNNRVSAMIAELPVGIDDPAERLRLDPRADGRPEGVEAGRRRRGAHVADRGSRRRMLLALGHASSRCGSRSATSTR